MRDESIMMKKNMAQAIEQLKKNWLVAVIPVVGIFLLYAYERNDESNARVENDIKEIKSNVSEIKIHTTVMGSRLQDSIANHNREHDFLYDGDVDTKQGSKEE